MVRLNAKPHVIPGNVIIPPKELVGRIIKVKWDRDGMEFSINDTENDVEGTIQFELINKTFLKESSKLFTALEVLQRCKDAYCPYIIEVKANGYHVLTYLDGETNDIKEDDFVLDSRKILVAGVTIG